MNSMPYPGLTLIHERKFSEFFKAIDKFEASGILHRDGFLYVVFDNLYQVAKIRADLKPQKKGNKLLGKARSKDSGYEGIAFNETTNRFYALVECAEYPDLSCRAQVHEYRSDFKQRTGGWWLDFKFRENSNKGFEGLAWLKRGSNEYLLALCEGNGCQGGKEGKERGRGRIQVFEKSLETWKHAATLVIPPSVMFEDYAGLSLSGNRVFVTSQESSALWIGTLENNQWVFRDKGVIYHFPTKAGDLLYCNIEGVCEVSSETGESLLAVVSDRRKKGKKRRSCSAKDQSIHIFRVS